MGDTVRDGGKVGATWWFGYRTTWPLASLAVTPDAITLSMWPLNYRFERASIRYLLKKRLIGTHLLVIVHTTPKFSKSAVFHPRRFSVLESALTRNGYQLTTDERAASPPEDVPYSNTISVIAFAGVILGLVGVILAGFVFGR